MTQTKLTKAHKKCAKMFVALLVSGLLLFQPLANVVAASDFWGHWAQGYIAQLMNEGVVQGDDQGRVNPENNITRAEFTAIVVRAFDFAPQTGSVAGFPDVAAGQWYYSYFATARREGIVQGDDLGRANPSANITRVEATVILARVLDLPVPTVTTNFADSATIPAWAASGVATMVDRGVVIGYPDGNFRPQWNLTRAEAFAMLARLSGLLGVEEPPTTEPPTTEPTTTQPVTTAPATTQPTTTAPTGGGGGGWGGGTPTPQPTPAVLANYFNVGIEVAGGISFIILEPLSATPAQNGTQFNFLVNNGLRQTVWVDPVTVDGQRQYRLALVGEFTLAQLTLQYRP